jgi:hypothetical protein
MDLRRHDTGLILGSAPARKAFGLRIPFVVGVRLYAADKFTPPRRWGSGKTPMPKRLTRNCRYMIRVTPKSENKT